MVGNGQECIECAGSGITAKGDVCSCGVGFRVELPLLMEIPAQYQGVMFNRELLPSTLSYEYGMFIQGIVDDVKKGIPSTTNIVICSPPNSGKTVLAYTCYGLMYAKGIAIPKLMDLLEVRAKLQAHYDVDIEAVELISTAPLAFFKIPMDVPSRFGETMSLIIERRVRRGGATIFLFNGEERDLKALDKFGKFTSLIGDGNYNSVLVKSFKHTKSKVVEEN